MTVQNKEGNNEADQGQQLVRKTTDGITSYVTQRYGQVKNWSPALNRYLGAVEGGLQQYYSPLVSKIGTASDPLIESLDTRLEGVINKVNTQLISPLQELHKKLDLDQDGTVGLADIRGQVTLTAGGIKGQLSSRANQAVEYLEGVKGHAEQKVVQWKSLRGDLSKKAVDRLEKGFEQVRNFSAVQAKSYIHVDLIEYAREVLDNAQSTTQPAFDAMQQQIAAAATKVTKTVSAVQDAAKDPAVRTELHEKLKVAMTAARELSQYSVAYVLRRYKNVQSQMSLESLQNLSVHSYRISREVVLSSPSVLNALISDLKSQGVSGTLEVTAKATVDHANQLLAAVKEVMAHAHESAKAQEDSVSDSDAQGPEAAEEEEEEQAEEADELDE